MDNIGKVVTREQIIKVATDPKTGRIPENWHQRLSELRTDQRLHDTFMEEQRRPKGQRISDAYR